MVLLPGDLMFDASFRVDVDNRFVVLHYLVRANDIILAFRKTGRAGGRWREASGVFQIQILLELFLHRLLEINLSEINDYVMMCCKDYVSCPTGFLNRERAQRMRCHAEVMNSEMEECNRSRYSGV